MQRGERTRLLSSSYANNGLSLTFAVICIVDVFGVFPIIALPKAVIDCGFYGILVIGSVCSLQIYTAILLGKCWLIAEETFPGIQKKSRYPYSALAEITYGKCIAKFTTFLLDLTIFGGGIPNLIVAAQNLQLLGLKISDQSFNVTYCYWMVLLGTVLCPVLWLGSPKDMKCLCTISVGIVTSVFLLVTISLVFIQGESSSTETHPQELWKSLLAAYGIIAFQFDIHPTILTIQVDMQNKKILPKSVISGFAVSLGMFSITAILIAVKYGKQAQPSILETLPNSVALHTAALLVAVQLCLTSAVSNSALYQDIEDSLNISRRFNPKRCVLRTILTILALVIAESVPRFDVVMSLIGGSLTGPLVFILPPLFYIKMLKIKKEYFEQLQMDSFTNEVYGEIQEDSTVYIFEEENSKFRLMEILFCVLVIIISSFMTITTTYLNVNNLILFTNFSKPCIYNISSSLLYM